MPVRVLLTGFGPFPGAPSNPTGALVRRLARLRRPALHDTKITAHVFETSYAAVDRELPRLLRHNRPDVLLMFGLATRSRTIRIETRARNSLAAYRDTSGKSPQTHSIVRGEIAQTMPYVVSRVFAGAQRARIPVRLSRDAGAYLCNYLCWKAATATRKKDGPKSATFIHVPKLNDKKRRRGKRQITSDDLVTIGAAALVNLVAEARRK